jgi:ATP-dependent DNA ligase
MQRFAETCEAIAATTKKLVKTAILADYLKSLATEESAVASVFFSGRPFPVWEEATLQVGGRSLWQIVAELSNRQENELTAAYRKHGDLGAVAAVVLPSRSENSITLLEVRAIFRSIAIARGPSAKIASARDLLSRATPLEAKYIIKIMTGDLRIGLKESLVEEAIAKAYEKPLPDVQRANMLLGDIGETTVLAAQSRLQQARMRLFHPLGFMLASAIESPEEGLSYFSEAAVEDKYDGIRAQAHISGGEVRIFSRTRDEITESFPELPPALAGIPGNAILDGEIVAWEHPASIQNSTIIVDEPPSEPAAEKAHKLGRARPFSVLQQRLGRKKVSEKMLHEIPVAFLAFDILYADEGLLIDEPLRDRAQILDKLLDSKRTVRKLTSESTAAGEQGKLFLAAEQGISSAAVIRTPVFHATSADELDRLFVAARARGNEGLMIKDLNSTYNPGKRGKAWLKMKRELATLDVVVTAVEYGHGKRIGVLSDYTFAVWKGETLVNIGKAYSGLTDAEIAEMTTWFLEHTIEDQGFRRVVEPKIVLEVAFNNMMRSNRHESGYALRFPRILRLRPDKSAVDADTIERVGEIFAQQT